MTLPSRTLGIAFSDDDRTSRLAGAVVRADGTLDGLGFETCTVGGVDATDAAIALFDRLGREDVRHVAVAGIAPAWFNLLELSRLRDAVGRPVYAVSYEESPDSNRRSARRSTARRSRGGSTRIGPCRLGFG